jgi:hypothetical protein
VTCFSSIYPHSLNICRYRILQGCGSGLTFIQIRIQIHKVIESGYGSTTELQTTKFSKKYIN